MARLYMMMILNGTKTLTQVPTRWREDAKTLVINHYIDKISNGSMTIDQVPNEPDTWRDWVEEIIDNQ